MTVGTAGARSSSRHLVVVVFFFFFFFFFFVGVVVVFFFIVSWEGFVTSGLFCACSKRNKMVR